MKVKEYKRFRTTIDTWLGLGLTQDVADIEHMACLFFQLTEKQGNDIFEVYKKHGYTYEEQETPNGRRYIPFGVTKMYMHMI